MGLPPRRAYCILSDMELREVVYLPNGKIAVSNDVDRKRILQSTGPDLTDLYREPNITEYQAFGQLNGMNHHHDSDDTDPRC